MARQGWGNTHQTQIWPGLLEPEYVSTSGQSLVNFTKKLMVLTLSGSVWVVSCVKCTRSENIFCTRTAQHAHTQAPTSACQFRGVRFWRTVAGEERWKRKGERVYVGFRRRTARLAHLPQAHKTHASVRASHWLRELCGNLLRANEVANRISGNRVFRRSATRHPGWPVGRDEDAAFECVVCLKDVRTSAGAIWQCPEGHMFCCVCFERIGGAASPCPSCSTLLEHKMSALEKQRDLRRAHHFRRATEAPDAAAQNAQPPVNGQAEQTTTVVTPVMSIQEQVLLLHLSQMQQKGEDV